MKAKIYCRECGSGNVTYLKDNKLKCNNCKNRFDLYDGLLDVLEEK